MRLANSMLKPAFFRDVLQGNPAGISVAAESVIVSEFPGQAVVACDDLDVEEYARLGHCTVEAEPEPRPERDRKWGGEDHDRLYDRYKQVVWRVQWQEKTLRVVDLSWSTSCGDASRCWVIAESPEITDAFVLDVSRKTHAPGDAILVFSGGRWNRNRGLYEATQRASFDDLVLADDLKETVRLDFKKFLESEERYTRMGIVWRRGAILIGPPGNGKTHFVRALVKELRIASLYVRSLKHPYYPAEQMWEMVFDRARGLRPCMLVLEDLDSLVSEDNRSFFLNQLDGFERNHGMIVLATTNHPERIDSAIIDRPSRFDRKYHFQLPRGAERGAYLAAWQSKLAEETNWRRDEVDAIAEITNGFSFAYLKELVISTVMKWMHQPALSFAGVMRDEARSLDQQMRTEVVRSEA